MKKLKINDAVLVPHYIRDEYGMDIEVSTNIGIIIGFDDSFYGDERLIIEYDQGDTVYEIIRYRTEVIVLLDDSDIDELVAI